VNKGSQASTPDHKAGEYADQQKNNAEDTKHKKIPKNWRPNF
jgi:hypothetical protein